MQLGRFVADARHHGPEATHTLVATDCALPAHRRGRIPLLPGTLPCPAKPEAPFRRMYDSSLLGHSSKRSQDRAWSRSLDVANCGTMGACS